MAAAMMRVGSYRKSAGNSSDVLERESNMEYLRMRENKVGTGNEMAWGFGGARNRGGEVNKNMGGAPDD